MRIPESKLNQIKSEIYKTLCAANGGSISSCKFCTKNDKCEHKNIMRSIDRLNYNYADKLGDKVYVQCPNFDVVPDETIVNITKIFLERIEYELSDLTIDKEEFDRLARVKSPSLELSELAKPIYASGCDVALCTGFTVNGEIECSLLSETLSRMILNHEVTAILDVQKKKGFFGGHKYIVSKITLNYTGEDGE